MTIRTRPATEADKPFLSWLEEACMRDYAVALWGAWRPEPPDEQALDRCRIIAVAVAVAASRRFTRLTNGFSKEFENHAHMVVLYTVWYNFVRLHKTLRARPAMATELTDRLWTVQKVVEVADVTAPAPGKRGPYKKRAA